ncbi:hypothetical protein GGI20_000671 [Coemansia sp. BCRC 34301]|nr:hypothetical protein GGI20_000671 [Coemansia sp. BCRC 34301]
MSEEAHHSVSSPADQQGYKVEEPRFRPLANAGGPGWAALGVSLFTFSFYAGAIGMPFDNPNVATLASTSLIVGGLVVFISGMWAFASNDTVHATIFTLYGSLFGAVGYLSILGFNVYNTLEQDKTVSHAAGTFWLAWMLVTLVIMLGTARYSAGTTAFMALLFISFVVLAGGTWTGGRNAVKAGGWFSFFASLTCIYNTFNVVHKVGYSPLCNIRAVTKKFQRKTHQDDDSAAANV